ncbi:hypothetical protein VC218_12985 [Xanthomonas nasturtii]|uniref:hypothetical protein n=1 Tax=Xanthomonas nasturtii TaxID=1843581 RepID=UPI002B22F1AE|nr:hypothetical protein [Xanthomonas nasturtii]MEA9579780.1 hypothetical protein [Xanthomonas nasturtii]
MKKLQGEQKLARTKWGRGFMNMRNKVNLFIIGSACLAGCSSTSLNVRNGVIADADNCRPSSKLSAEIARSQMACHQGISGDGVQVIIAKTNRLASTNSDTTQREMVSIFIQPAGAVSHLGPVKFNAFYSSGLFDFLGKTGCVGVLEDGSVDIKNSLNNATLTYALKFKLISPLGWLDDCKGYREVAGSTKI